MSMRVNAKSDQSPKDARFLSDFGFSSGLRSFGPPDFLLGPALPGFAFRVEGFWVCGKSGGAGCRAPERQWRRRISRARAAHFSALPPTGVRVKE